MIKLNDSYYGVEVPKHSADHQIIQGYLWFTLGTILDTDEIQLPSGTFSIVGMADKIGEEEARNIAINISYGGFGRSGEEWMNYKGRASFRTALESFATLLESLSLDPSRTLIIKKI